MILYPLVISAIAVFITLCYASYLDIRDRRVPFVTWMPMLAIGIICTSWLLFDSTGNYSVLTGFLTIVASFLYANYLDNREEGEPFRYYYLVAVLILPAFSWFVLPKSFILTLIPWFGMFVSILSYISYMHVRSRPVKKSAKSHQTNISDVLEHWYFVLILLILAIASFTLLFNGEWGLPGIYVALATVFCGVFYIFGRMHLFGGADTWALLFISFCVPTFPITPLLNNPPLGFFSFSVLINGLILNLAAPVGIFVMNFVKGNRARFPYTFFGFPVQSDKMQGSWGFVMEEFTDRKGVICRRFIGLSESLRRMYTGRGRMYTKDLREHPENYQKELSLYKKAGTVWISYAIPFIVPITAGFVTAVLFGDFLFAITKLIVGGV